MSRRDVDLNLIAVFIEVYRLRSITKAADSLDSNQPAVSGMLKRLSEQLGEVLFIREGRGISPTYVAVQLANEMMPAYHAIEIGLSNLKAFDIEQPRVFNVVVTEPMLLVMQPLVNAATELGGCKIHFQLAPHTAEDLFDLLSLQKVDLAIDLSGFEHPSYQSKLIHSDQLIVTCSQYHSRIAGSITQEQYYIEQHVRLKLRRVGSYAVVNSLSKAPLQEREITTECDSIMSGLALASSSEILCIAPKSISQIYGPLFNLQELALPFATNPLEHYMIWHKRTDKSAAHSWLRDKLLSLLSGSKCGVNVNFK